MHTTIPSRQKKTNKREHTHYNTLYLENNNRRTRQTNTYKNRKKTVFERSVAGLPSLSLSHS